MICRVLLVLALVCASYANVYRAVTGVNIRSGAGTGYSIVGSLYEGEKVTITAVESGWGQHSRGWSSMSYLELVPDTPSPTVTGLTAEQLRSICPRITAAVAASYAPLLNTALQEAQVNTPLRIAHFMAQVAHESGELAWWEEFASGEEYEGRTDLGNTQPGDGKRFKGRGPIQITGRANYKSCGDALGVDLISTPTLLLEPKYGFRSASWYWNSRGINAKADRDDLIACTKAVNGGTNGLEDRRAHLALAKAALGI
eukprot:TRINITY_DN17324_c0_g1_i1.p1 TRINITY_DN17324_c0_g1~~TRINITY_DN17324_c0_g1_i1.p1  ORF type:complete len:264 (+),score=36.73 TRINITY_DN17324_c0_g1_i1:22-792(+)